MSTTFRTKWLRVADTLGVKRFLTTSSMGYRFVCHIGDFFGEFPFYNRESFRRELELCAAWLRQEKAPLILDVGANVGFWSTHLAQMLANERPTIYAFEPVPQTLCKLVVSIQLLGLDHCVYPIAAAVGNEARVVWLSVNPKESGFAQVTECTLNTRAGNRLTRSVALSLDEFVEATGSMPSLVKIDVEGSEVAVLEGASALLAGSSRPALLFELNPLTLAEMGTTSSALSDRLSGYSMYYVDDFEGQRREYGAPIPRLEEIDWVCNVFAVPTTATSARRFSSALTAARIRVANFHS